MPCILTNGFAVVAAPSSLRSGSSPSELFGISEQFGKEVIRRGVAPHGSHLANNMDSLAKCGQVGHSVSKTDRDVGRSVRWEPMTMSAPLSPGCGG